MEMYFWLLIGFVFLIKGADFFVDGSSSIAKILKVPSVIIGLTIVAMGTSAPEAAVSITAGLAGSSDISLGNILGSNIFNLLMVIGVSALIRPFDSPKDILHRDMWWNLGITITLFVLLLNGTLSRGNGIVLLIAMAVYLFTVVRSAMHNRVEEEDLDQLPLWKSILFIIIGLLAIVFGGDLVVDNAQLIALSLGMSNTLIGLTIVAIGTSLPELVTSIVAARKGDSGIALGNAVGSGLFNIMFILGMASVLSPIHVAPELLIDTLILFAVSMMIFLFARSYRRTGRLEGAFCVLCYIAYSSYIIMR
ncbi:MAG: calcium/sodium antiporter [Lachnospiraceae bacterium]|nr:calcium/sodium antiporter [Lachnospiraceae bacterium]